MAEPSKEPKKEEPAVKVEISKDAAVETPVTPVSRPRKRGGKGGGLDAKASPFGDKTEKGKSELTEKVVFINRCAKVVKGGRRFSFSALVVAGDGQGNVGCGFGKANEVSEAIRKGTETARKSLVKVSIKGNTIPHEVEGVFGGGRVLLRPASAGTGIVAGGGVRPVVEAAGIRDVIGKTLGPSNILNVVKATLQGLQQLRLPEDILRRRGMVSKKDASKNGK